MVFTGTLRGTLLLKTLSLVGFKSFADRTRLEFHAGVNVVVGPNGSGKSNLLDAMAWVMGTQATLALRTQKMDDVIFAGTATRPRVGRAEVTLTFDNKDRFLPLDLEEISMTRRLYRDGTSEYLLNGTQCRLLDLHEILADGGVGRHQHVLVSQGEIGEILSARPEEHRAVIEEAAGITKHRSRRDRSVRRLEQTRQDVERLVDILDEQRRRLRPLKRQANAALRYDSVRTRVRDLQLWLGGEALRGLAARGSAAAEDKTGLEATLERDEHDLERIEATLDGLRRAAGVVGTGLERDTAAAARLETMAERLQRIASVARERRRSLEGRIAGVGERTGDLELESGDLVAEIGRARGEESASRAALDASESTYEALEDEERALTEQVGLSAEGLVANLRGDLRALEAAAARDTREREALDVRRKVVSEQLETDASEHGSLVAAIETTDAEAGAAQGDYESASATREAAQARWDDANEHRQRAALDREKALARKEAIESALAGEGDPRARDTVAASDSVLGSVVERLDVPPGMAPAIDAVLGALSRAYVADDVESVAASLKAEGLGGISLVSSDSAGPPIASAAAVAREWGIAALTDELGPDADHSLAVRLLGDVVLVEGWSTGWDLVRRYPDLRAATPEGDVISSNGMYLAQPDGVGPAALEAAAVAVEATETDAARADSSEVTARRAFEASRERERSTLELLESLEARLAGHTEALALIDRATGEHGAEMVRLGQRQDALDKDGAAREERIAALRDRLGELEGEDDVRQQTWEALNQRRQEIAVRKLEARRLRDRAAESLARTLERGRILESRLTTISDELDTVRTTEIDSRAVVRLEWVESRASTAVSVSRRHISTLRDRQRSLRERSTQADAELATALGSRTTFQDRIVSSKERLAALAIELAEVEIRTEATAEALRRDADAAEETALAASRPVIEDDATYGEALGSLEARLRRMGPINPLAADEYSELADRVETLETQLADLEESVRELRKVIAALDETMSGLFVAAFEDIAATFEENFALVFPGGRGRLRLTDPTNPLSTGVEIHAQPLGKKVGRLSLLSGGERSLAALAFLFAVFRARPSPFYVLDEVEAALDDANLRRFLRLVDTLRQTAQLVIITHQQQTMGAADILYGVTMEPGESSLIVAKRLVDSVV